MTLAGDCVPFDYRVVDNKMLDPQYLWLFGLLIGLGAFTQGFTGIGFGIMNILKGLR